MKPGDKVIVLDHDFKGVVLSVSGQSVTIRTTDGFDMEYFQHELVIVNGTSVLDSFDATVNLASAKKQKADFSAPKKSIVKRVKGEIPPPEIDLHIEKLVKNSNRMPAHEKLEKQLSVAEFHINLSIQKRMPKLILIHGVGEGILREELEYLLRRFDGVSFRDASYQKFGSGAMEVSFRY